MERYVWVGISNARARGAMLKHNMAQNNFFWCGEEGAPKRVSTDK